MGLVVNNLVFTEPLGIQSSSDFEDQGFALSACQEHKISAGSNCESNWQLFLVITSISTIFYCTGQWKA